MSFHISEVTSRAEFDQVIACERAAYQTPQNSLFDILYPFQLFSKSKNPDEAALHDLTERQWADHTGDPSSHWLKAVDTISNEIIGAALWNIYPADPCLGQAIEHFAATWWPQGELRTYATEYVKRLLEHRANAVRGPHMLLDICFVNPAYRHRGVAASLVDWGTKKADELDLDIFLESSQMAVSLYGKHGFVRTGEFSFELDMETPKDLAGGQRLPPLPVVSMHRPLKGRHADKHAVEDPVTASSAAA